MRELNKVIMYVKFMGIIGYSKTATVRDLIILITKLIMLDFPIQIHIQETEE